MSATGAPGGPSTPDAVLGRGPRLRAQARFGVAMAFLITAIVLWVRSGFAIPPVTFIVGVLPVILAYTATGLCASVGLIIALRRPEVRMGRILAWVAIAQGLRDVSWGYLAVAETSARGLPLDPAALAWLTYMLVIPLVGTLLIGLALIFPTDRPMSPRWWRVAWLSAAGGALVVLGALVRPGPIAFVTAYENPVAPPGLLVPALALQLGGYAAMAVAGLTAAGGLVLRYRRADDVGRAQLRVFVATGLLLAGAFVLLLASSLLGLGTPALRDLIAVAFFLLTGLVPVAVLVAIARYRLFELDQVVGRGFVYGALVAILAGLYAASIRLFTALFTALTGESSDASLVITTLILATTFTPIKARLETMATALSAKPRGDVPSGGRVPPNGLATRDHGDAHHSLDIADPELVALVDERIRVALASDPRATRKDRVRGRHAPPR